MRDRCGKLFCGRDVRGALAGNGAEMAAVKQGLPKRKAGGMRENAPGKKPRSRKGGKGNKRAKATAQPKEAEEQRIEEEECTDAKKVLQRAAHRAAAKKSEAIANKLADRAALGDTASARMLVVLMDGHLVAPKLRPGELTLAQRLMMEPQWQGDPDEWAKEDREGGVERGVRQGRGTRD